MPGIVITLTGSSAGYERMLQASVAQAKTAGREIAVSLRSKIAVLEQAALTTAPGSAGGIAIQERLTAARLELARTEAVQMLAIKRASGVQLSLAEALQLKQAGLEYRSLTTVAAEAEAMKVAANKRAMDAVMQQEMEEARMEMALQDEKIAAAEKAAALKAETAAETVAAEIRATTGALEWAKIEDEARTEEAAREAAKRVAIARAEEFEKITAIAKGQGARVAASGGHGSGGLTGIVRESLVIAREVSQGRGTGRIGGSITLLAQYLGVLKLAVKSTATESLLASKAATELSKEYGRIALAAKGTSGEAYFMARSLKQEQVAAGAATEANIALAGATTTVRWAFFGWLAIIIAAVAALFYLVKASSAAAASQKDLEDHLAKCNNKFEDGVEALNHHHKAMLDNAQAAADLADFQDRLAKKTDTTTDALDEQLKSMQEQFQMEKKIAEQQGKTPKQIAKMEQDERKKELEASKAALAKITKEAADAKDKAIAATKEADEHKGLIDEDKGKNDFDKTIEAVKYLDSRIPQKKKDEIAKNQAIYDAWEKKDETGQMYKISEMSTALEAQDKADKIRSTEYGKQSLLGLSDGKAMVSPDEVQGIYQQALAQRARFLGEQEGLESDQLGLNKNKTSTQQTAEEKATEKKNLEKKVKEQTADVALHDEYDKKMMNGKSGGGGIEVTSRERIGLGAASSVQMSLLTAANQQVALLQQINMHVSNTNQHLRNNGVSME